MTTLNYDFVLANCLRWAETNHLCCIHNTRSSNFVTNPSLTTVEKLPSFEGHSFETRDEPNRWLNRLNSKVIKKRKFKNAFQRVRKNRHPGFVPHQARRQQKPILDIHKNSF